MQAADGDQAVQSVVIRYQDGSSQIIPLQAYNIRTGTCTFEVQLRKAVSGVEYVLQDLCTVTGKISGEALTLSGATVTFVDRSNGLQYAAACSADGSYKINLFPGVYDVLAVQDTLAAVAKTVSVQSDATLDMTLEQNPYYLGSPVVSGQQIASSKVIDAVVNMDAVDGTVTVPANNTSMAAVLSSQIYTGSDSFR